MLIKAVRQFVKRTPKSIWRSKKKNNPLVPRVSGLQSLAIRENLAADRLEGDSPFLDDLWEGSKMVSDDILYETKEFSEYNLFSFLKPQDPSLFLTKKGRPRVTYSHNHYDVGIFPLVPSRFKRVQGPRVGSRGSSSSHGQNLYVEPVVEYLSRMSISPGLLFSFYGVSEFATESLRNIVRPEAFMSFEDISCAQPFSDHLEDISFSRSLFPRLLTPVDDEHADVNENDFYYPSPSFSSGVYIFTRPAYEIPLHHARRDRSPWYEMWLVFINLDPFAIENLPSDQFRTTPYPVKPHALRLMDYIFYNFTEVFFNPASFGLPKERANSVPRKHGDCFKVYYKDSPLYFLLMKLFDSKEDMHRFILSARAFVYNNNLINCSSERIDNKATRRWI